MFDVVIIGGGIFGSVIAKALTRQKHSVVVLDAKLEHAGSKPAACLMRPSWFSSLGKEVYEPSLRLLNELYSVQDIQFKVLGPKKATVHWCPPASILSFETTQARAQSIKQIGKFWKVSASSGKEFEGRAVVVAAGIWTPALASVLGTFVGKAGMACLWPAKQIETPSINVWAPYRQIVAFNRGDGLWVGEGTATDYDRWTAKVAQTVEQRCNSAVGFKNSVRLFGIRPYSDMKPCYLKQERPGLWVATGGAKNGTLAAGWCAAQLVDALA